MGSAQARRPCSPHLSCRCAGFPREARRHGRPWPQLQGLCPSQAALLASSFLQVCWIPARSATRPLCVTASRPPAAKTASHHPPAARRHGRQRPKLRLPTLPRHGVTAAGGQNCVSPPPRGTASWPAAAKTASHRPPASRRHGRRRPKLRLTAPRWCCGGGDGDGGPGAGNKSRASRGNHRLCKSPNLWV